MRPTVALLLVLSCTCPLIAAEPQTELERLAAKMKPGEWAELKTKNYTPELIRVSRHHIYQYTHDGQWDPRTKQFLFLGQGHYSPLKFIAYSAATNSWKALPTPTWWKVDPVKKRGPIGHAYDNNAFDPAGRIFYHQQYNSPFIHRYDVDKKLWIDSLKVDGTKFIKGGHSSALAFFPEMGGLVRIHRNGHVDLYEVKTGQWKAVSRKELSLGKLHPFIQYNSVHKVVIFGGGNGSNRIYRLDPDGKITPLSKPLVPGLDSTHRYVVTVDPVSGDFLVIDNTMGGKFYAFDVKHDRWQMLAESVPASGSLVAAPVSNAGVILVATYRPNKVWLYKHRPAKTDGRIKR